MVDAILLTLLGLAVLALVWLETNATARRRRARARFLEPLRALAEKHSGEIVERPRVAFVRTPRFTVAMLPDRDEGLEPGVPYHIRFEAPFTSPQFLEIWPRGSRFAPLRLTVARDVTLADSEFGRYFVLRADDAGFARGVLTAPLRSAVYKLWQLGGEGLARVDVYPYKVAVQKEEPLGVTWLLPFVDKCLEFAEELQASVREQEGVEWLDAPPRPVVASCPICGSVVESGLIRCLRCKTVHHRECWEWNEGCSMFACGETRFELE